MTDKENRAFGGRGLIKRTFTSIEFILFKKKVKSLSLQSQLEELNQILFRKRQTAGEGRLYGNS